jgi:hypothetical protein
MVCTFRGDSCKKSISFCYSVALHFRGIVASDKDNQRLTSPGRLQTVEDCLRSEAKCKWPETLWEDCQAYLEMNAMQTRKPRVCGESPTGTQMSDFIPPA